MTLLARGPLSGYDLAQLMKRPLGFFWQAQHSQIYPELADLEEQGYVFHQVIVQEDRPQKKLYTITALGRSALKEWVTRPPLPAPERNEFLLKTYTIWLADQQQALVLFREQESLHVERLVLFEQIQVAIEQASGGAPHPDEPRFGDYATVRIGIAYEQAYVSWCRWMREQLEQTLESQERE